MKEDEGVGETNYLKAKCNALIDKALQKKKELEEINMEIQVLEEEKASILARLENAVRGAESGIHQEGESGDTRVSQEQFVSSCNQILQKLNELSERVDVPEQREEVRKISVKEKAKQLARDYVARLIKFLGMLVVMGMLSLLATILLDPNLRNMLIELLKECVR